METFWAVVLIILGLLAWVGQGHVLGRHLGNLADPRAHPTCLQLLRTPMEGSQPTLPAIRHSALARPLPGNTEIGAVGGERPLVVGESADCV
jgi:hypothetical protein